MRRWRQMAAWWSGLGLLLLLLLARNAAATGPSYPTGLTATTISCGANPHVRVSWDISTPDPANNSPIWFYQVFKWDGPRGAMRADLCNPTCPGTATRNFACCPGYSNAVVYPYGATSHPNCDVNGHCSFEETLDFAGGPWYYAVLAVDRAGNLSQTPSTCNAPYVGGGGVCDLGGGCTPFPCFQCSYNGTSACTTPGYCTPPPGACLDIGACVTGPTTTTTSTSTTSTTTTLVSACASPTVVAAGGGVVSGTTSGASTLQGTCGTSTGPEKVYQWTPSLSGVATIQTCGGTTNFDTALYMRASTCTTGTEVACNDDSCACGSTCGGTWASKITPTVTAGTTYYIIVDGRNGASGNFTLTVTPPSAATTTSSSTSSSTTTSTSGGGTTTSTTLNIPMTWKWNKAFVGTNNLSGSSVQGVAIDASGNVAAAGKYQGTVDFGTGNKTSTGAYDVFVAKYGPTGTPLWAKTYGETSFDDEAKGVAFDPSGNVVITGVFHQTVDFGDGPLSAAGGTLGDIFLAKYDGATGNAISGQTKRFGNTSTDQALAVTTDTSGNVFITGQFNGSVDFGNGTPIASTGGSNIFVAKYNSSLAYVWAKSLKTGGRPGAQLATDASGNVYIGGGFDGTIDLSPGGTFTGPGIYVAELAAADGAVLWARSPAGANASCNVSGIALDGGGNLFVDGGFLVSTLDFGTGALGSRDSFIAKYNSSGTIQWAKSFGSVSGGQQSSVASAAADGSGFLTMVGAQLETTCFGGGGPCEFTNQNYSFGIARFNSAGANTWHLRTAGGGPAFGLAATAASTGRLVVGGNYFSSNVNFGGGALPTPLAAAGCVVVFDP